MIVKKAKKALSRCSMNERREESVLEKIHLHE